MYFYDIVFFNNVYFFCFLKYKLMFFDVFVLELCFDKINLIFFLLFCLYVRLRCLSFSLEFVSFFEFVFEISFFLMSGMNDFCRIWKLKGRVFVFWI